MSFAEILSILGVASVIGGVYFEWRLIGIWLRLQALENDEPVQHETVNDLRERVARLEERTK